jgi:hypothetical protein
MEYVFQMRPMLLIGALTTLAGGLTVGAIAWLISPSLLA